MELIGAIVAKKSAAAWLEGQLSLSVSTYADLAAKPVPGDACLKLTGTPYANCARDNFTGLPLQMRFYANAMNNDDQVRQRVAFALSQIIVGSEAGEKNAAGIAAINQTILSKSLTNYRDLIEDVTFDGYMGSYLNLANSDKAQPNENYARELMQLFTIGTSLLNPDGTPQLDASGSTIASYTNADVKEVARALTGWTWPRLNGAPLSDNNNRDLSRPMIAFPSRFDAGAKSFLGKTIPAGATQQANVDAVVDTLFNHPNIAPFVSRRLIQQLTVANPTPAYVKRVAAAFANNGSGVRGDMKAVVRAIYLDPEARIVSQVPGKVKEPVLLVTSLARAIGFKTDGFAMITRDAGMGQTPFRAPSVFNFYPYDYPLPRGGVLVSPVSRLMSTPWIVARHNLIYDWTVGGEASRTEFQPQATIEGSTGSTPNWTAWEALGTDDGKILDRISLVLLNGTMTSAQRQSLMVAMAQIKNNDPKLQTRRRAQMALYVVASSPLFQVDR